jgi:hypothetical protein
MKNKKTLLRTAIIATTIAIVNIVSTASSLSAIHLMRFSTSASRIIIMALTLRTHAGRIVLAELIAHPHVGRIVAVPVHIVITRQTLAIVSVHTVVIVVITKTFVDLIVLSRQWRAGNCGVRAVVRAFVTAGNKNGGNKNGA